MYFSMILKLHKLVFVSDSPQYIADHVGFLRSTILRYTITAELYLNRSLISYDPEWTIQGVWI